MRLLLLAILTVFAFAYDQNHLEMQAKVFEKLLLLDTAIDKKVGSNNILPVILFYDEPEELDALRMKRFLEEAAWKNAFPYELKVTLQRYSGFSQDPALAYYLLESSNRQQIQTIADFAAKEGILTFSYNYDYLKYGVMLSLGMDKKVYPILNPDAIKESKINFNPILIRIAKKYQP